MMKFLFFVLLFCFNLSFGFAQTDSLKLKNYWSPNTTGLRTGIGYAKALSLELGISYHKAGGDIVSPEGRGVYTSIEFIPSILPDKKNNLYGVKAGIELGSHLSMGALEIKYMSNFKGRQDVILTPKIGLGLWTMIGFMYGYNISVSNSSFEEIGNHQFSIVVNIDRLLLKGF